MKNDFWIGTAPFCNGNYSDCKRTPGYIGFESNKKGNGKKCWLGKKVHCKYSQEEFNKTAMHDKLHSNCPNLPADYKPEYKWFGTAPLCDMTDGEVANKGYLPIKHDVSGDGAPCVRGYKVLGMKPACAAQEEELARLKKEYIESGSPNTFTRIFDFILRNVDSLDPKVAAAKKGVEFIRDIVTKK